MGSLHVSRHRRMLKSYYDHIFNNHGTLVRLRSRAGRAPWTIRSFQGGSSVRGARVGDILCALRFPFP